VSDVSTADVARLFDGSRLTLARHLAGVRKNGLAEQIAKSATAIASYESGHKRPAAPTVAQLALALGVEPAFFLPGPALATSPVGAPHFRSLRSTSQLVRDQAYAFGQLAVAVAAGLERHVEFPERDIERIDAADGTPEVAAQALRQSWGLGDGPLRNLVRAAENHGILVVFTFEQAASVDAYSFDNEHRPVVLLNPTKRDYFRQRFDLAHEIGHLVMHGDADPGGREVEDEAHRFASELLMPAGSVKGLLPSKADWRKYGLLKEQWGVSMQALLFKAKRLEIMSPVTYRNAMTTVSSRGWRRQEPGDMPTVERPSLLPRAVELLAEEGLTTQHLAQQCRVPHELFSVVTSRSSG
jgi:Zn-dependent peptidase ImmA (M78 family)/transcriptional regulator with XRE-family HTH domain